MDDDALLTLAAELGATLRARGWMLALAESCTGGMVAQCVTAIPGSSAWFDRGFVTYSNPAKVEMLGVREDTLALHGAVSEETVREMVRGALACSGADIAAAISGIAGPDGGTPDKPVGTVWLAWRAAGGTEKTRICQFEGDRQEVRRLAAKEAFQGLLALCLPHDL